MIPVSDEIRRPHLPAVTFLLLVLHMALFISALDGHFLNEGSRLHELVFRFGLNHNSFVNHEWLDLGTYWIIEKSWYAFLANNLVLFVLGPSLENRAGKLLMLVFYMVAATVAGVCYAVIPDNYMPMVGASGAIAGILGAYAVQIDLQTKIKTICLWYEQDVSGFFLCFAWIFAQILLVNYQVCDSGSASMIPILGGFLSGAILGFVTKEWTPNVVVARAGSLQIVARGSQSHQESTPQSPPATARKSAMALATSHDPLENCPYCQQAFQGKIVSEDGMNYYQCEASGCRRLVFLSKPPMAVSL